MVYLFPMNHTKELPSISDEDLIAAVRDSFTLKETLERLGLFPRGQNSDRLSRRLSETPGCSTEHFSRKRTDLTELAGLVGPLIEVGLSGNAICKRLHINHRTLSKVMPLVSAEPPPKDPNWVEIAEYYATGATCEECAEKFGIPYSTVLRGCHLGHIKLRPPGQRTKRFTAESYAQHHMGKRTARGGLRKRILDEGTLPYECEQCGLSEWRGEPLTLRLDHRDGDGRNHATGNLRFLCPNCDSQQPTYGHRNRGRYKESMVAVV